MQDIITQPGGYPVKNSDHLVNIERYNPELDEWVGDVTWTDRWGNTCHVYGAWSSDGKTIYTLGGLRFDVVSS